MCSWKQSKESFLLTERQSLKPESVLNFHTPLQTKPHSLHLLNATNSALLSIKSEGGPWKDGGCCPCHFHPLEEQVTQGLAPGCAEEGILVLVCLRGDFKNCLRSQMICPRGLHGPQISWVYTSQTPQLTKYSPKSKLQPISYLSCCFLLPLKTVETCTTPANGPPVCNGGSWRDTFPDAIWGLVMSCIRVIPCSAKQFQDLVVLLTLPFFLIPPFFVVVASGYLNTSPAHSPLYLHFLSSFPPLSPIGLQLLTPPCPPCILTSTVFPLLSPLSLILRYTMPFLCIVWILVRDQEMSDLKSRWMEIYLNFIVIRTIATTNMWWVSSRDPYSETSTTIKPICRWDWDTRPKLHSY